MSSFTYATAHAFPFHLPSPAWLLPTENKTYKPKCAGALPRHRAACAPLTGADNEVAPWLHVIAARDAEFWSGTESAVLFLFKNEVEVWNLQIIKGLVLKLQYAHPRRLASALWWYAEVFQKKKWTLTIKNNNMCIIFFPRAMSDHGMVTSITVHFAKRWRETILPSQV